jgi:hypothetical protein
LIWSVCFASLTALLGLILVGPRNVQLIIFPHMAAPATEWLQGPGYSMNIRLEAAVPLLVVASLGALLALFSFYSPVFYHHQLLITIPAALLAAAAIGDGILSILRLRHSFNLMPLQTLLGTGALIGFVWLSIHYAPVLDKQLMNRPRLTDFSLKASPVRLKVIRAMNKYVEHTNWIMTDVPMYAFRVQRPVPPSLATFSSKRLATGSLTEEDILTAMREYQPEQVLMARFEIPALDAYLQENYTLILYVDYFRLYLRNDLEPAAD